MVDVEATPGGPEGVYVHEPQAGRIGHANHFVAARMHCQDLSLEVAPSSPIRLEQFHRWAEAEHDEAQLADDVRALLQDHTGHPTSICRHEDPAAPPLERMVTVASAIMRPASGGMWVAAGNPCRVAYAEVQWSGQRTSAA
jgi:isopenicillin-N N-acyltransferase-like protein